MSHDDRPARDALNIEAARWVVLLNSGHCTAADRADFAKWRSASAGRELAYQRELYAWERTERLQALRSPANPVETVIASAGSSPSPQARESRWPLLSLAASLLVAVAIGSFLYFSTPTTVYATAIGERRVVQLQDGSRLELNTDTEVAVRMTRTQRTLELVRGESLFDVQPDPERPFVVAVGATSVRAVGTTFAIRRDDGQYEVLVTEGIVEVSGERTTSAAAYQMQLPAGSGVAYGPRGLERRQVSAAEQERSLSWRTGTIALAGETLAESVAEFNRYNSRRMVVADPAIRDLRLGGYFDVQDIDGFIRVLATAFAVDSTVRGNEILLTGPSATQQALPDGTRDTP